MSIDNSDDSFVTAQSSSSSYDSLDDIPSSTLGETLNNNFSNYRKNFNVCHINAQSIPSHFLDFHDTFDSPLVHAVLISESWLKPTLPSISFSVPGYLLVRNDRIGKQGGGVAIYIKSHIKFKIVAQSPSTYNADAEFLFLEVDFGIKLILGVVYCPPNVSYFASLESVLESLMSNYTHFLIMGDLNTCFLRFNSRSQKLHDLLSSLNFTILDLGPTHHTASSDSLLDLIITSHLDYVATHGQLAAPAFSHHDLIFSSLKIRTPKPKPVILHQRNFSQLNLDSLLSDASLVNWSDIESISSLDDKVVFLNKNILTLFDKHAPIRPVKIRRPPAPWFGDIIRRAMGKRDRAFRRYKRFRNDDNWEAYKKLRNICNKLVRNAKRRFIAEQIELATPSGLWSFLRSLGLGKIKQQDSNISLDLNILNRHFTSNCKLSSIVKQNTLLEIANIPRSDGVSFSFSSVSQDRISKILSSVRSKAVGSDDIGRIMIMHIISYILPAISHIINFSLSNGVFPDQWRNAQVIPLPKVPNPVLPQHFRPISILPFLSKIIEAEVHRQLTTFLSENNLHNSFQSGFRAGHSTTTALLRVTDDIRLNMENTLVTVLVLIDFSNAFNAVDHDLLLAILPRLNFSTSAISWFSSYLSNRNQIVRNGQNVSDCVHVDAGVPQGGIISPLLFSLFINLLSFNLNCSYHMYADDLQLYFAAPADDLDQAIFALNNDLSRLLVWSKNYGIFVNPNKCQAILIGSTRQLALINSQNLPNLRYDNVVIPFSSSVKDLGIFIDNSLSWNVHVQEISRKFYATFHSVVRLKNFLPIKTKICLVNSLMLPIIDYADVCFLDLNSDLLNKLDRLLNTCIRFIFNLKKYDHVTDYRVKLKWLTIRERRNVRILGLLFSILNDPLSPKYLKDNFLYLSDDQPRSCNNLLLKVPRHTSGFFNKSFAVEAVRLWNELPSKLRSATSKVSFKKQVRDHYFKKSIIV